MSLGKKLALAAAAVILIVAGYFGYLILTTKSHSPAAVATYHENGIDMQIDYCRPYKKERLIFGTAEEGALLPFGKYWRLGANEATKLTLESDVNFGGKQLAAGSYSLYAFPESQNWVIGINTESDRWGATPPDFGKDIGRIKVPVTEQPTSLEQFTISMEPEGEGAIIVMQWDRTAVRIPVTAVNQ